MISSIVAAMLLIGTMNSNAQSMNRNDKAFNQPRQEVRNNNDHMDVRTVDARTAKHAFQVAPPKDQKVIVVNKPEPRPVKKDNTGNTIVAAAVGAAVGAIVSAIAK